MSERSAGLAGVSAVVLFWPALLVFGALHPDYSHFTKAISELGAIGAPHAPAWNLVGFIIPGLLLARCGAGLAFTIEGKKAALWWLLVLSGLGFVGAGIIPTEMRNGAPYLRSPLTVCHILMAFVSGIPWSIATLLLVKRIKQNSKWHRFKGASLTFAVLGIAAYALHLFAQMLPFFAQRPGLAQRLFFAVYFGWFLILSLYLLRCTSSARNKTGQGNC